MKSRKIPVLLFAALLVLAGTVMPGCTNSSKGGSGKMVTSDSLYVRKVENLSDGFILGADISSLLAEEASGVKYYDFDGKEADLLKILSENGVNYVRVRVWNDPFDKDGHGYGGGNCNLETAIEIGRRAKKYGMGLLVNFHYSDFWADPSKQMAPKAWKGMSTAEKKQAVYDYTKTSLEKIRAAGITVGMVQIGNETTGGIAGEKGVMNMCSIFASAAEAVRAVSPDILIAVHFTNPESVNYNSWAYNLAAQGVDYDVFATSYYPYWHGTLENLHKKLEEVATKYNKKVMVAETQWAYTEEDSDFSGNSIGEGGAYDKDYFFSPQGQANEISAVVRTIAGTTNGIGVFYWEPAWIRVPADTYEASLALWEKNGSGWASSYAGEYDPDDAGKYYGGSACDNQALFDRDGHPLESLKVFALLRTGNEIELAVSGVDEPLIEVKRHNAIVLPETVDAVMSDNSRKPIHVQWVGETGSDLETLLRSISDSPVGTYKVRGIYGYEVGNLAIDAITYCSVKIVDENYVENYGFEQEDRSMWRITNTADGVQTDYQKKSTDAFSGDWSLHFWNASKVGFTVEQDISGLRPGKYSFSIEAQGGDFKDSESTLFIYVLSDGKEYREAFTLTSWREFKNPTIKDIPVEGGSVTVGVSISANGGAWGTLDDFLFNPVEE
ncbi:MAG: glycosyl hydrolase 53 family protein [Lachnospiraceae bacterium]|nr:glycosyl hydrolase 53 family protein [Lachnospiraceae bacterium]